MQKSEQFTATWDQVDLEKGYIYLSMTKNGSDRFVTLNSAAVAVLKGLKKHQEELPLPPDSTLFHSKRDGLIKNPCKWFARVPATRSAGLSLGPRASHDVQVANWQSAQWQSIGRL